MRDHHLEIPSIPWTDAPYETLPGQRPRADESVGVPRYLDRELSWLAFNERVLAQAADSRIPLLERLRYLSICGSNLDEFFEIRIAGLKQQLAVGALQSEASRRETESILSRLRQRTHSLVNEQYALLNQSLMPALREQGVHIVRPNEWTLRIRRWLRRYFEREVLPVLTPIGLDSTHPVPNVPNKSLNVVVVLGGEGAFGRAPRYAMLQIPRFLPRIIQLPTTALSKSWRSTRSKHPPYAFVSLSEIVATHIDQLFPGAQVEGCFQFRVTRNSDLWVQDDDVDDLLDAMAFQLQRRNYGAAVRLEVSAECPTEVAEFLLDEFNVPAEDLYRIPGPVNLHRFSLIYDLVGRADLKFEPLKASVPAVLEQGGDVFALMRKGDVLLHHPFESFSPVLQLLEQAAVDPDVVTIKMTLYRTGTDSPVVGALLKAARLGKQVTAVVELRARFDEQTNIDLATALQTAGVHVVYGIVGYKTHAKMILIVRREGKAYRRYVHLGTGNYHPRTARAYTDISLLSARRVIGSDVHKLFFELTGMGRVAHLEQLLQAPFTLEAKLLAFIDREVREAKAGRPARIMIKVNSLCDTTLIDALYAASSAGVKVDLIVRGICTLRPHVPGLSENITVRSIVGRFLEHSRVYYFYNAGSEDVYCGSADWMPRNIRRRVECGFPVTNTYLKQRVIHECLELYLQDNTNAWELQADGTYERLEPMYEARDAQAELSSLCS